MPTFTNQAAITYGGTTTLSNVVTGELVDVLTVTKQAVGDTYVTGEPVAYVISIVNSGTTTATGVSVTDNLGTYPFGAGALVPLTYVAGSLLYYVNGETAVAPTPTSTSPLTVEGLTVPAGGSVQLVYAATPNAYAPLGEGGSITNIATVDGGGLTAPLTATETVTAADDGTLNITKSLTPTVVSDGDTLTYTLTVENSSTAPVLASGGAIVTDTFDPILSPIAVTFNGTAWTAGTEYTYNPTTGAFATLPGALTVPAATAQQNPATGEYTLTPGISTITITGTV
jgi:uncharacterized repeat protein (TIGR01451 family)